MQLFGIRVFEASKDYCSPRKTPRRRAFAGRYSGDADIDSRSAIGIYTGATIRRCQRSRLTTARRSRHPSCRLLRHRCLTHPFDLRPTDRDFSKPAGRLLGNPIKMYRPTTIPKANFANSVRLDNLVKDGKIYLSLSDAIALAIENNYDIAIARYDLDIADTDILRTRAGALRSALPQDS